MQPVKMRAEVCKEKCCYLQCEVLRLTRERERQRWRDKCMGQNKRIKDEPQRQSKVYRVGEVVLFDGTFQTPRR